MISFFDFVAKVFQWCLDFASTIINGVRSVLLFLFDVGSVIQNNFSFMLPAPFKTIFLLSFTYLFIRFIRRKD